MADAKKSILKGFFAVNTTWTPVGKEIWLMENDDEEDLFGPYIIAIRNANDNCEGSCPGGTNAMYPLKFTSSTATSSHGDQKIFSVGVSLRKFRETCCLPYFLFPFFFELLLFFVVPSLLLLTSICSLSSSQLHSMQFQCM